MLSSRSIVEKLAVIVAVLAGVAVFLFVSGQTDAVLNGLAGLWYQLTGRGDVIAVTTEAPSDVETLSAPLANAELHVNGKVLLLLAGDKIVYGTLLEVRPTALVLRQKISGGTVTLTIEKSRIRDFQVAVH